jgi:putative FmdB family regulatory protein
MPTYDYKCEKCGHTFEEDLKIADRKIPTESPCVEQILHDDNPAGQGFEACGGELSQVVSAPYFGYDNIHTRHSTNNKEPGWFKDKITDLKKNNPGHSM